MSISLLALAYIVALVAFVAAFCWYVVIEECRIAASNRKGSTGGTPDAL